MQKINRVSLRHERKKYSQLRKVSNHNNRSGDYSKDHIDESRTHLNRSLYRKHSNAHSLIEQLNMTIEQIPEELRPKINKNTHSQNESVVVLELVLSASPEWFESTSKQEFEQWVSLNEKAIKKRFGDNLLSIDLHLDEKTPHFHICTMPLELA
ncbi:plasmid recombination protein, partial [Vibrio vulnificus]